MYRYLGAYINRGTKGKTYEVIFKTFAPSALRISVFGEFSGWTDSLMKKVSDGNSWKFITVDARLGMRYKYRIYDRGGYWIDHCDPCGFGMKLRPNAASIIRDMEILIPYLSENEYNYLEILPFSEYP